MAETKAFVTVSPDWLYRHLGDPNVVVLDCRWRLTDPAFGQAAFERGHIPGAQHVDLDRALSAPLARYGGRHPLPEPLSFQQHMRDLGIDGDSLVVCYGDDAAAASRCWWCLTYYGHHRVSVLDGGIDHWSAKGYPLSQETPPVPPRGSFVARPRPGMLADYQTVRTLREAVPLIDARAPERFHGTAEPIDAQAGHIPGAVNYPYTSVLTEAGTFRSPPELEALFRPVAANPNAPIVYCGSGVTACVVVLAMRTAGHEPLLYPGSWSDWIQHQDAPIAAP